MDDNVYNDPYHHHGLSFIIATLCFSFQIFCDFSGYSDMAIGIARTMGFNLMKNFNSPYHSKSIREFWARWHISLSTWFRDYLYIPMGGNRVAMPRLYLNLLVVFLISGLWHGANWTYIIWGALHGFYLIFAMVSQGIRDRLVQIFGISKYPGLYRGLQLIITFMLVSFAWIFFRSKSVGVAFYVIKSMFSQTAGDIYNLRHNLPSTLNLGLIGNELWIAVFSIMLLEVVHLVQNKRSIPQLVSAQPAAVRWALYYGFLFLLVVFSVSGGKQFIYFQF